MIYDRNFLFEYLTAVEGEIWKQPVDDLLLNSSYLLIMNGGYGEYKIENNLPQKLQNFLKNYYWKENNQRIAEDICSKISENMLSYYFQTFNLPQLSIILFAICYGISEEQLSLFCKKGMTASNMSSILNCLITTEERDVNLEKKISENFKGRFSEKRFYNFIQEYYKLSKIRNL